MEARYIRRPGAVPTLLYGADSNKVWMYIHGREGRKEDAAQFAQTACSRGWQVLSVDLPRHGDRAGTALPCDPWHAVPEIKSLLNWARWRWDTVGLYAVSLGAWFSLLAFDGEKLDQALLVSPVLDMQRLILEQMERAGVDEARLKAEGSVSVEEGEELSWRWLQYARECPIRRWDTPTAILCAGKDALVPRTAAEEFAGRFCCELEVAEEGAHWFHIPEQLELLRRWEEAHMGE